MLNVPIEPPAEGWRGSMKREAPLTAVQAAWQGFGDAYLRPFHRQWRDRAQAGYMLDLVAEAIFAPDTFTFYATEKAVVLPAFLAPWEEDDGTSVNWTLEDADAALRFLVEENMVVMDGDLIWVHPRFADMLAGSPPAKCW
jgi:hypothetical protein